MTETAPPSSITYSGYLALDDLLAAQHPLSDQHDEMLFVIIHQTKELWLKQILHEVALAQSLVRAGDLVPAYKSLARVSRIQAVMTMSWDILATMTPADYLRFRGVLGSSSGFQSDQFRRFEAMLGLKDARFLKFHTERPAALAALQAAIDAPSLYDDALSQLAIAGLPVPVEVLNRDVSQPYEPSEAVEAAWLEVYRATERWWPEYVDAARAYNWMSVAGLFMLVSRTVTSIIVALGRARVMTYLVTFDLVMFSSLAWWLVPSYGPEGAAMATFFMEMLNMLIQCALVFRYTRSTGETEPL
jgi:tryptophan 2,3-dioxygenase